MAKDKKLTAEDKKILSTLFWRSNLLQACSSSLVMQGHGVLYTLMPYLNEFYKDDDEERRAAWERHNMYYNVNPYTGGAVWSLMYVMEKKRSENKDAVSAESIQNMKIALMGPLAAIGDTIFQGSLGNIIAGLAMGFAMEGSWLGPILHLALWQAIEVLGKAGTMYYTYTQGESFITRLMETNLFSKLEDVISIVGLMMMGVLAGMTIKFNFAWEWVVNEVPFNIQTDILDKLLPGMMPLVILFIVFKLIKKRVQPAHIIYGMLVLGVILSYLHIV